MDYSPKTNIDMKKIALFLTLFLSAAACWAQPSFKYTNIFERCQDLWSLQDEFQRMMRDTTTTREHVDAMTFKLEAHLNQVPQDRSDCHYLLGELHRKVLPTKLRNSQTALKYYEKALEEANPERNRTLATIHIRIATVYDHMYGYPSLFSTLDHISEAARFDPTAMSMLGDYALFGWGLPQDLYLAAQCYNQGIHNGSSVCNSNLQYLFFLINEELEGRQDTIAEQYMEHAVYQIVVQLNWDSASYWLYKAADRDFVPAIYEIGLAKLNGIIPCYTRGCRDNAWDWIEKAALKNYPPALFDLALHTKDIELMQHVAESGYPDAMIEMGNYYASNKLSGKISHHDPERAAYWYLLAAKFADNVPLAAYDSIVRVEQISPDQEKAINQRVKRHYSMLKENHNNLIEDIRKSPHYGDPTYRQTSYNQHKSIDQRKAGPELPKAMVKCYKTRYDLMAHEASRYMSLPGGYEKHDVVTTLDEMFFLRQRANKLVPNAFPANPLEKMR